MDLVRDPWRIIDLSGYTGDAWAQPSAQVTIPVSIPRLRCLGGPVRLRAMPYDGTAPGSAQIDGDTTTLDICLVKIRKDPSGAEILARTSVLAGASVGDQYTEVDVSHPEIFVVGIVSVTVDTAAALWIYIDAGADLL